MLFGREYMPEGAGVDPDAPRKKGAARLWEILSRDLDGIFLSGVLAMLACAPGSQFWQVLPSGWAACPCACWRQLPPDGWWVRR